MSITTQNSDSYGMFTSNVLEFLDKPIPFLFLSYPISQDVPFYDALQSNGHPNHPISQYVDQICSADY